MQAQLSPSAASPQPLGTIITWQATASGAGLSSLSFRFSVAPLGSPLMIVRDYETFNTFAWTPSQHEGWYEIQATVRNNSTQATAQSTAIFRVTSLVTRSTAVVSPTANPLVALYSAPACPVGSSIAVKVEQPSYGYSQWTSWAPCVSGLSMNFYIAGMRANTTYQLSHSVVTGSQMTQSATLFFTTGSIPISIPLPDIKVYRPAGPNTSLHEDILIHSYLETWPRPIATDFYGNVVWYYAGMGMMESPLAGGTMLMTAAIGNKPVAGRGQLLREIDLAGNTVRETSADRVSEQLQVMGEPQPIDSMNHEAVRLPNGYTAVLASLEKMYPAGTQGSTGPVDILGNIVLILDENWQLVWYWNAFDHLDISHAATLGDLCQVSNVGCPPLILANVANDWLHANSIEYDPSDGNLIVSLRAQDWIVKIEYSNGTGSGKVLWRLGMQGDFTMNSTDPYPWFSHQHDARLLPGGLKLLSLYDNGNTRVAQNPELSEHSRGQVLLINESARTARLMLNQDLGVYSQAFGSTQPLANGDFHFMSGWVNPGTSQSAQDLETSPSGSVEFLLRSQPATVYRSFRIASFYNP